MKFNEYQKQAKEFAIYPTIGESYVYLLLGLSGETGEVLEKFKKILRDKAGILIDKDKEQIKKELGDILWYITQLGTELNIELDDIAETNIKKLISRKNRNKLNGSGDNR